MKLFINSGVYERKWNENVRAFPLPDNKLKLKIPIYQEDTPKSKRKYITFILPNLARSDLKYDVILNSISLKKSSKNVYRVEEKKCAQHHSMYALLRGTDIVPDDIYIPTNMKNKVTVIQRFQFIDNEVDYGNFLSNIYLIKIKLEIGEYLPIYLTNQNSTLLQKHYVFFRGNWKNSDYHVTKELETYIILSEHNKEKYISLSHLCELDK